jgi:type IV pilus secretin PilQ/predicted competence protein
MGKFRSRRGPFGPARLATGALLTAGLLLGCASGSRAPAAGEGEESAARAAAPSAPVTAPTQITSLELRETAPGARLEVEASAPLVWTQYRDSDGRLVLELPNSALAEGVSDLGPSGSLVESVAVRQVDSGERPMTRLVIATRQESEHELAAAGNSLHLTILPVGSAAAEPVATAEAIPPMPVAPAATAPEPTAPVHAEPVVAETRASSAPAGTPDAPYVAPAPSGVVATRLDGVEVSGQAGNETVRIVGDGDFAYSTFQLTDPPRYVIDLRGVVNSAPQSTVAGSGDVLQRVRLAQFKSQPEPVARVVLDLASDVVPRLTATGDGLVVSFGDSLAAAPVAPAPAEPIAAWTPEPEPAPAPAFEEEPVVVAEVEEEFAPAAPAPAPAPAVSAYEPPPAAPRAQEPSDVSLLEAVEVQDVAQSPESAEPAGEPAFESREIQETQRRYVGDPINMSLRDADIKEVIRTFAKISGLNMVVQPGVSGAVTVELEQVPWDQALEMILKTNNLGYQLEGNIMRIAPRSVLNQEAREDAEARAQAALAVPLRTVLKRISYASADEVASLLDSGDASILSGRGSVVVDFRTNTLIIKELPEFMDTVLAVIDQVDVPEPQVMIEARIVETTKRFNRSLGIQWGFDAVADAAHGNTSGLVFPNNGTADGGVNLLTGGQNAFLNLSLGNVLNTFNIDIALQAAESEGLINILSAPKVATLNNVEASIQSGLQIPVQTVANNTVTVQFVNATLRLNVTPHVTADGTVLMDIEVQKREPQLAFAIAGATNAPIATREARTRVIVRDGGTAVIGGIYEVSNDQGEDRVPGLADLPILGYLFRNRRATNENEELLIFITPRVIKL